MAVAPWGVKLVTGGLLVMAFVVPASAQTGDKFSPDYKSSPQDIAAVLGYKPRQEGIDYSIPTPDEQRGCTMKLIVGDRPKSSGWLLLDAQGRPLRRFMDNTGEIRPGENRGHTDTWSYFKDGVEIYREIDTNANDKPDQFRWLNGAGTKWGVDSREVGKIDKWRTISSEEAAQEAFYAVVTKDFVRFKALLISEEEIRGLKLPETDAAHIRDSVAKAESKFKLACDKLTSKAKFERVETAVPQCIPADAKKGPLQDLLRYPSRTIVYDDGNKKTDFLQSGDMIQVGQAWRLVEAPFADFVNTAPTATNPGMVALEHDLNVLDKDQPTWIPGTKDPKVVKYYAARIGILEKDVTPMDLANAPNEKRHANAANPRPSLHRTSSHRQRQQAAGPFEPIQNADRFHCSGQQLGRLRSLPRRLWGPAFAAVLPG